MYISWRWCEQTSKSWCSDDEGVSFERRCLFIWQTRFFPVVLCTVRTAKSVQISFLYFVPWINLLLVRFLSNFLNYFSSISWISGLLEIFFLPCKIWRTNTKNRWWSFILDTPEKTSNFRSKIEITIRGNFTHRFTHCAALFFCFCFNKNKQYFTLQKKAVSVVFV